MLDAIVPVIRAPLASSNRSVLAPGGTNSPMSSVIVALPLASGVTLMRLV